FESVTTSADGSKLVDFLGWQMPNTVLYTYALSLSFLLTALLLPLLTGIADYTGKKKAFLKGFAYLGASACAAMFFFDGSNIEFGILTVVLASIGYSGGLVFYDAYLPEIATADRFDKLSAKGYSLGYIGSVILLIFNLVMLQKPELFGLEQGSLPARISFLTVAVWWVGFAQITFKRLPDNPFNRTATENWIKKGYRELRSVYAQIRTLPNVKRYVLAYFFFNAGVQAVMYLASLFGAKELQLPTDALIKIVLLIQLVAIGGAYLFANVSNKKGNIFSLMVMIVIWIGVCIMAFFVNTELQFYGLAILVGLVMGGIQALSRSTYSKLIPTDTQDHASFFSFYDVTFNLSIVAGTIAYGTIELLTGSMRYSALGLGLFFIIGLALVRKVEVRRT
ncbi:MAG: UMF1 family MFS transporter, partial [Nonlabens sp.]